MLVGLSAAAHAVAITVMPRLSMPTPEQPVRTTITLRATPPPPPVAKRREVREQPQATAAATTSGPVVYSAVPAGMAAPRPTLAPRSTAPAVPALESAPRAMPTPNAQPPRPSFAIADLAPTVSLPPPPAPAAEPAQVASSPAPVRAVAPAPTADDGAYRAAVRQLLEGQRRYPARSRRRGEEGVVRIAFRVDSAGRVSDAVVLESSGHAALDRATLELLRRCEPLPTPPRPTPLEFSIAYILHER